MKFNFNIEVEDKLEIYVFMLINYKANTSISLIEFFILIFTDTKIK